MQGVKYIPEPDYYHKNTQPKQYQKQQNQNVYLPQRPNEDICTWYGRGRGRARPLELHGHRLYGEKTRSLESQLDRKHKKNQHLREHRAAHT